jgi:hypothetical protein
MRALQRSLPDPEKDMPSPRDSIASKQNLNNTSTVTNTSTARPNTSNRYPSSVMYDEIKEDVEYDEITEDTMSCTITTNPTKELVDDGYLEPNTPCAGPSRIQDMKPRNTVNTTVLATPSGDDGYLVPVLQHVGPTMLNSALISVKVPLNPGDPGSQYDDVLNLKDNQEVGEYHYILHKGVKI